MSCPAELPIGVFDSGVGGISVLAEMLRVLPDERFIYFGDCANAPYGSKSTECVRSLALQAAQFLLDRGVKCLVVACNTATSAAITVLRATLHIPVVGMEPALKPAVEMCRPGAVLVLATPLTLREEKFWSLVNRLSAAAEIEPVSCPGLVELIESGLTDGDEVRQYLSGRLSPLAGRRLAAVVLGCTHYVFVRRELASILGGEVPIVDGNAGTVRHLRNVLRESGLLRVCNDAAGRAQSEAVHSFLDNRVTWYTSGDADSFAALASQLLRKAMGAGQ